jgi:siderophore synthetase component
MHTHRFISTEYEDEETFFYRWAGCNLEHWSPGLIPIHPWQLDLSQVVQSSRLLGMLDLLSQQVPMMPLASHRTCRILATGYDVKLPIDATLTSERRLLYPLNTLNAPIVSALARALLEEEGPDTLEFQYDVASVAYPDERIGSHLAAIIRSPLPQRADDVLIPALLLWTNSKLAGALLQLADHEQAYDVFLAYCRILMSGPVEFYARWGLAFEPHLQNALIRIRGGWPTGLVLRDLDATILDSTSVPQKLRKKGLRLPAERWDAMPAFASGGQRLMHALLYAHLSQVMCYMAQHIGLDVNALMSCVEHVWGELLRSHSGAAHGRIVELRAQSGTVKRLLTTRMERSMDLSFADPHLPHTR